MGSKVIFYLLSAILLSAFPDPGHCAPLGAPTLQAPVIQPPVFSKVSEFSSWLLKTIQPQHPFSDLQVAWIMDQAEHVFAEAPKPIRVELDMDRGQIRFVSIQNNQPAKTENISLVPIQDEDQIKTSDPEVLARLNDIVSGIEEDPQSQLNWLYNRYHASDESGPTEVLSRGEAHGTLLAPPPLSFTLPFENQSHWFFKNKDVAVQLASYKNDTGLRIVAAFPGGNSGAELRFENDKNLAASGYQAIGSKNREEVRFKIKGTQHALVLRPVLMDDLKLLREQELLPEIDATRKAFALKKHLGASGIVEPKVTIHRLPDQTIIAWERRNLGTANPYRITMTLPASAQVNASPEGLEISDPRSPIEIDASISVPFKAMSPLPESELFSKEFLAFLRSDKPTPMARQAVRNLEFLIFQDKFTAGGWTYFTYFGRDTELTLLLLKGILSVKAYEAGLQSLLDRLSGEGQVAHEEELGSLNEIRQIQKDISPDPQGSPYLMYNMIDGDFMLPIVVAEYVKKTAPNETKSFLDRTNARGESNYQSLLKNFDRVLRHSGAFAQNPIAANLIALQEGSNVGNWRDSDDGLGGGRYPADVNSWLVPQALKSILFVHHFFENDLPPSSQIRGMYLTWRNADRFFKVTLSPKEMRERINAYLAHGPLSPAEKGYFLSASIQDGITVGDFLKGKTPKSLQSGLTFPALSLDNEGKPISILHSDPVLPLFLGILSDKQAQSLLPIFSLPFPVGLQTKVGMLTANPAYSKNDKHWQDLTPTAYHGEVTWVWPQTMLQMGLASQKKPSPGARKAAKFYKHVQSGLGPLALSELYAWQVDKGDLKAIPMGEREGSDVEGNPVQLWSNVLPAMEFVLDKPASPSNNFR